MPLILPVNGVLTLEGTASVGGKTYRLMAQRTPTPDPLVGVALGDREGELYLGGARAPMFGIAGWSVVQGQAVRVVLRASDLADRVGQGRYWIALLAGDVAWTWRVAAAWEVEVDFRPFPVYAYTSRLPNGTGVVLVVTPLEGPERAELTLGDLRLSQTWGGFRRRRDGAPGFAFTLPREASGEGVVRVYRGSRYGQARFRLAPWPTSPSERTVNWRLPFWLPAGQPPLAHLLEAVAQALPDGESVAAQVNPDRAQGRFLPIHAALFAATPDLEESEDLLRLRLKAIPSGIYASIPALRAHLKALTQGGVAVSDASSTEGRPQRLDGTWRLDGTQVLGGDPGLAVGPGRYLVRFYDAPMPWSYYWKEIARLRPAGLEPVLWQDVGGGIVRLGVQVGAKEAALGPYRGVPLPEYRRVDGTWRLDGSARLASGMVARGAVVPSSEIERVIQGPNRDILLTGYRRVDGTWALNGTTRLASGMVVRGAVVVASEVEVAGWAVPLPSYRRVDGTWRLDGTARLASGMVTRGAVVASPEAEVEGNVQGPNREVLLTSYRRVDGTWRLDGTARLASGMVTRGAVVAS